MKVTQEKLPASQLGLEIEISQEVSKQTYEQTVRKLAREVRIPGFRKGKVPRQILIQRLGAQAVKAEALQTLLDQALKDVLKRDEIKAIGNCKLTSSFEDLVAQYQPGEILTFSASVDILPEVTLKQITGLSLQAEEALYNPDRVDEVIEHHRKQRATLIPVEERVAQMGDVATLDFEGRFVPQSDANPEAEPELVPGGSGTDMQIDLEPGQLIPGLVEGIVGMALEETQDIEATFPEDYMEQEVAGRAAIFRVTLKELKERELPELNDEFAQEISEAETLADLRQTLEERYQAEAEQKTKSYKETVVFKALRQQVEVDLPETLIEDEVRQLITQTVTRLGQQGIDMNKILTEELVARLKEETRPEAIDSLSTKLAIVELAKQQSFEADEAAIQARSEELLEQVANRRKIDPDRLRDVVEEDLLREQVFEWFVANNTIELVPEGSLAETEDESDLEQTSDQGADGQGVNRVARDDGQDATDVEYEPGESELAS
jgi:trigger factor